VGVNAVNINDTSANKIPNIKTDITTIESNITTMESNISYNNY